MIFKIAVTAALLASPPAFADRDKDRHRGEHERGRGQAALKVPPGHLPPPGECRIWFPGRPPGHQPPPGDCGELIRYVPRGAVLIEG